MQSAFKLQEGKRFIVETTPTIIRVYHCDQDWKKISEFSSMALSGPQGDYHLVLRKSYLPKYFVEEKSSVITE
jgi:hypothetical protein